jgi:adenylate cyclase
MVNMSRSQRSPASAEPRDAHELERLLRQRNEHPESLREIDREICDRFTETVAVMVVDMIGFSRLTQRHGIIHFLAMIERMHDLVLPVIGDPRFRGRLVKTEADNVFATFADVAGAVAAAQEAHRRLEAANRLLPADWDLHVSIGIGYGEMLIVGDDEMYGHELNVASKLGEDVGCAESVLLSEAAYAQLASARVECPVERRAADLSGLSFSYFCLVDR